MEKKQGVLFDEIVFMNLLSNPHIGPEVKTVALENSTVCVEFKIATTTMQYIEDRKGSFTLYQLGFEVYENITASELITVINTMAEMRFRLELFYCQ